MLREYLIHFAHKVKWNMQSKSPFKGRGVLLKLADKIISTPTRPMTIRTLYGFKMMIDPVKDNGVEKSIYYSGTYEAGTLHVFNYLLKPGDVFFDIGSNIGLMAIFAAKKVGNSGAVHAFEPEPSTFKILQQNCKINHLQNIKLNNLAIGSQDKEGLIYLNMDINRGASSLVKKGKTEGTKISITTLDNYLALEQVPVIQLIKIDIEGYEFEMLKGASNLLALPNAPILCIEYSNEVMHTEEVADLYKFIKGINNYRIFKFATWKGDVCKLKEVYNKDNMPGHDNVFCFLPGHLEQVDDILFD